MTTRREFNRLGIFSLGLTGPLLMGGLARAQNIAAPDQGVGLDSAKLLDRSKVESWIAALGVAWEGRDSEKAVRLFTADAKYRESAFEPPMVGHDAIRKYWTKSVSNQQDIKFGSTLWSVSDTVAIAHWTAKFLALDTKKRVRLDGVLHLTFQPSPSGALICSQLLEWWFVA